MVGIQKVYEMLKQYYWNINSVLKQDELVAHTNLGTQKGEDFIQFMVEIVAEGVENKEQYGFLQKIGCDVIQGYYCSKPLQIQEFETLLIQGFSMKKAVNR